MNEDTVAIKTAALAAAPALVSEDNLDTLITMDPGGTVKEPSPLPWTLNGIPPAPSSAGLQRSLEFLDAASHEVRLRTAGEERSDKGTSAAYARHVRITHSSLVNECFSFFWYSIIIS